MKDKRVQELKAEYPKGTRIKLINMKDDRAVAGGALGTVRRVDDIGTIHVNWDNGRQLGLIVGLDDFQKLQ